MLPGAQRDCLWAYRLSWDHVDSKSDQALKSKQCKDWRKAECIAEYGFNHDPKRAAYPPSLDRLSGDLKSGYPMQDGRFCVGRELVALGFTLAQS
jgi:hypothetical protein